MHGLIKPDGPGEGFSGEELYDSPVEIIVPARLQSPLVFASPHSGRTYPASFIAASRLDPTTLRASEDAFVDELFNAAPGLGAPLAAAQFPRALMDANREPWELDPDMFDGPLPAWARTRSPRLKAGLGSIPRIVADGAEIYRGRLPVSEAHRRIEWLHRPYHAAIEKLLNQARAKFGIGVLIDCHSMPSVKAPRAHGAQSSSSARRGDREARVDVVLGDRFGSACAPRLVQAVERRLTKIGLSVWRNAPYAGGWSTERYGRPGSGLHALQIEINRDLYLHESRVARSDGFDRLRGQMEALIKGLIEEDIPEIFRQRMTA